MDSVATMPAERRTELFRETAARRNLSVDLIEKDFWVCWSLHRLFSRMADLPASLLFKGGTSLSKVFGAVERFSEDVDLSLNREDLGFGDERDPYAATSRKQARRLIDELTERCVNEIRDSVLPILTSDFVSVLGPSGKAWSLTISPSDPQTILFAYPRGRSEQSSATGYIQPQVRLEIGARSDHWPVLDGEIEPYAATEFPNVFAEREATVRVLAAERTFWEKVTLLHAEHHRPAAKPIGERLSRHYYDVAQLFQGKIGQRAVRQIDLLESVVRHKRLFFHSGWANYQAAVPGSIRLLPKVDRAGELARDYESMGEMIFAEAPSFDFILQVIGQLQEQVNVT
jgi:predicted nucleotidyltransferase component of viral defense system